MPLVLLVDDESSVRQALRRLFERGSFSVCEADSGPRALEAIAASPAIAAVVSDFVMPEVNRLDFYDQLVTRAPHLRDRVVLDVPSRVLEGAERTLGRAGGPLAVPRLPGPTDRDTG